MRSIVEIRNYQLKDSSFAHIKFYLDYDKVVKYDYVNVAPFLNEMAIISKDVDQVTLNELLNIAYAEIQRTSHLDSFEALYIEKDMGE